MLLPVTALYAAISGIMLIGLSIYVSILRGKLGVSLMGGGNIKLVERIRRHGNFTENVPITLILMATVELNGASATWLHAIGLLLVISRIIHPFGIREDKPNSIWRILGALGAQFSILTSAVYIFWFALG